MNMNEQILRALSHIVDGSRSKGEIAKVPSMFKRGKIKSQSQSNGRFQERFFCSWMDREPPQSTPTRTHAMRPNNNYRTSFPKNKIKILLLENVHSAAVDAFKKENFQVRQRSTYNSGRSFEGFSY